MKNRPQVVAVGYSSEFSLDPLCDVLVARDIPCTRIDMYDAGWREHYRPPTDGREVVLLSSQHPSTGRGFFSRHYNLSSDVLNLTDAINFFDPARSFLFPHDLTHPFYDEEVVSLRELTAVLAPDERFWYLRRWTPVHVVGWPKLIGAAKATDTASGAVFMPTDVATFSQREPEVFRSVFGGLLRPGIRFKLPAFSGTDGLRSILLDAGCEEIPATANSAEVIARHATVISNGLSSIVSEAALVGKDVICVKCGVQSVEAQWHAFSSHPNVELVDPPNLAEALSAPRRGRNYTSELIPLDIDLVVSLISGTMAIRHDGARVEVAEMEQ
ncbi:hypothetical protein [Enhydrobacter sp.]|uniref:hypothetical protein n=1 Tax=Enhydrobacter sp. TaxID=1894999 RepID=UPI0026038AC1|nr:hypothetical protein [Enhydrobacter sp.]WIM13748.1 MAG: hypothetical protein OJF58_004717 [Enhydrobacter sp.]